jgi:ketosteroid isomerase-like protein
MNRPAGQSDAEFIRWALGSIELGVEADMTALFQNETVISRLRDALAPDAVIEFATPYGGFMGEMAGPFRGLEGLQRAWAEWTDPWEAWSFRGTEWIDAGGGRVLLLGDSIGRLAGSGVEMETHAAALYTVENDRIVRIEHFLDQDQARRAAGLD